jgi:hypothetical protein
LVKKEGEKAGLEKAGLEKNHEAIGSRSAKTIATPVPLL